MITACLQKFTSNPQLIWLISVSLRLRKGQIRGERMETSKMKYVFPVGLFLAFLLDGTLSSILASQMFTSHVAIESRLILLWFVMAIFYGDEKVVHIYVWAFLSGLLFDVYYTGFLGIMAIIVPFIVYLNREATPFFGRSFIMVLLIYLIDITILTAMNYFAFSLIGQASTQFDEFVMRVLWPTLVYNIALFVMLFVPVKKVFTGIS